MQKAEDRSRKPEDRGQKTEAGRQNPAFSITFHGSRFTPHVSRFTFHASRQAFTMIEIAISLAIIGFALVAIIGVLPIGMNVQKDNREETIINQDATVFMDAIRNGAQGLDDLTNYVMAITNEVTIYNDNGKAQGASFKHGYTPTSSDTSPEFRLINGGRIVGLLSTPKYVFFDANGPGSTSGYYSNHVVAYVRSISGPANEKFPQDNSSVQDFAFSYLMTSEVVPYWTNYFDPSWVNQSNGLALKNLQENLKDVRLVFRWPLRSQGKSGLSGQSFRTLVGGFLQETNEPGFLRPNPSQPSAFDLYFFQPWTYVKAP
jgi:type II secretory pathway pseudopilin PulG